MGKVVENRATAARRHGRERGRDRGRPKTPVDTPPLMHYFTN